MLKFLSKVVVEYCPLDPRKAAAVELLAQCNGRKAKDSNPACSVELRRLPSPPPSTDPKSQPTLPPPRVLVTYLNGAEEAIIAAEGATAQGIRDQILARGRLIDTEQMFRDGGEKWPVLIPEEELGMSLGFLIGNITIFGYWRYTITIRLIQTIPLQLRDTRTNAMGYAQRRLGATCRCVHCLTISVWTSMPSGHLDKVPPYPTQADCSLPPHALSPLTRPHPDDGGE